MVLHDFPDALSLLEQRPDECDLQRIRSGLRGVYQIGSVLSPLMVTFLLKRFGDWNLPLFVMGGFSPVIYLLWRKRSLASR